MRFKKLLGMVLMVPVPALAVSVESCWDQVERAFFSAPASAQEGSRVQAAGSAFLVRQGGLRLVRVQPDGALQVYGSPGTMTLSQDTTSCHTGLHGGLDAELADFVSGRIQELNWSQQQVLTAQTSWGRPCMKWPEFRWLAAVKKGGRPLFYQDSEAVGGSQQSSGSRTAR